MPLTPGYYNETGGNRSDVAPGGNKSSPGKFLLGISEMLERGGNDGVFREVFFRPLGQKRTAEKRSGDMRKATGAGPALAAHSKDAKTTAPSGQNATAARKKADG